MTEEVGHSVLIVGAEGFIGQHTVRRLSQQGCIVNATHFPANTPPPIEGVKWISCDLTELNFERSWPDHCESVIYLAQSQQWRDFPDGASDILKVNVVGTMRTAEYARNAGASRMIFMSSGSVYSQSDRIAQEDDALYPGSSFSFYTASKLAAELLLKPYSSLFSVITLRLFMPYGPDQNATMLLPVLVRRVQEKKTIILHGKDGLFANPVYVADVVETLYRCLTINQSATLNIAGPEILTLREIANHIGKVLKIEPRFETNPDISPKTIVGNTNALRAILGWSPPTDFKEGISKWLRYTK